MLNNPDDVVVEPETESTESFSPWRQIVVIALVGLYLFGMVWFYTHIPMMAVGGVIAAGIIMASGAVRRWLSKE